jgi:hypothetical protein
MRVLVAIGRAAAIAVSIGAGLVAWIVGWALTVAIAKLLLPSLGGGPAGILLSGRATLEVLGWGCLTRAAALEVTDDPSLSALLGCVR